MFRSFTLSAFIMMSAAASAATLNNWEDAFLPLQDEAAEPGIIPFATTIARFYDETAPCAEGIARRGASGGQVVVQVEEKKGYVRCEDSASGHESEYAYWKREDGHYLAAVAVMANGNGDEKQSRIYFYDINPDNNPLILIPNSGLSKRINAFRAQDYIIRLPSGGKDLLLKQPEGAGGATHYLQWTGNGFAATVSTTPPAAASKTAAKDKNSGKDKDKAQGDAQASKSSKPPEVVAIGRAYRAAKQLADSDATRLYMDIRHAWANRPESMQNIEYLFSEGQPPYLIYVHDMDGEKVSYEEFLFDVGGGQPALLFWFQKLETEKHTWEYRLYFDHGKVIFHDVRENGGKPKIGAGLPAKHGFGKQEGKLAMQQAAQNYLALFGLQQGKK